MNEGPFGALFHLQHPSRCTATPASSRYRSRLRVGIPGRIKSESAPFCLRERTRASRTHGRTHVVIRTRSVVIGARTGGRCNTSYYHKKGIAGSPRAQPLLPCSFCYVTPMRGGRAFRRSANGQETAGTQGFESRRAAEKWQLQHPAARQKRRPVKTATADDFAERQAVIKACTALVERLKAILQTPPQVALWRLGLEQAIAAIEEYRGDVRDLLV